LCDSAIDSISFHSGITSIESVDRGFHLDDF
jgi:hypothetical protein